MIYSNYGTDFGNLNNAIEPENFNKHEYSDVSEDEIFSKIQTLLNCDEMEDAHDFLYSIDMDELNDDIISKVNDLYDLAVDRGFVALNNDTDQNNNADWLPIEDEEAKPVEIPDPASSTYSKEATDNTGAIDSAYSVLYSATKDGEVRTGECYSNAVDPKSAKVDAISKLANLGFDNIEIFAVEFGNRPEEPKEPETSKEPEQTDEPDEFQDDSDFDNPDDEFQEYA